ncbi:serine hydrolase domain-containing protein [Gilliamella sp. wkB112]|uniref:serine hydrolase domain-containing protein n=1 Tax=Gilliamella sp. wkB112 TaxID=3120257 RepID=UPI00080E4F4F|nr:serine hydrolase domain-containing protein [Gilliamella apicola]OCG02281.1 hypothetical protein A9G12_11280 [Gilliamella apicola]
MNTHHLATAMATAINQVNHDAIENKRIVGSVVMVAKNGEIVYQQASGYANREQQIPMHTDSLFLLSSVTKPIVTAAALCLVEQGVLDLQSPVTAYLPSFTPKLASGEQPVITLHHLLTHSAGLKYRFDEPNGKGNYNSLQISDGFDQIAISVDENLKRLSQATLIYQPGTNWCYSLALDVLGAVLAAATKKSLATVIKTLITEPLNMPQTGFAVSESSQLVTHYYDATPQPLPMPSPYFMHLDESWNNGILSYDPKRIFNKHAYQSGGAGMVGNAPEFMQFLLALTAKNNPISQQKLMDKMTKCYVSSDYAIQGPGWGFGYGGAVLDNPSLAKTPQGKGTIEWGGVYGHDWFYDPQQDLAVVIFTNTAIEGMAGLYTSQIKDAVYHSLALICRC